MKSERETVKISIVEDDKAVRTSLCNLLESAGLNVEAYESAEEFVESGPLNKKACLILDILLPRMSGLELQQLLSGESEPPPIIFLTSNADSTVREKALQDGAADFFNKPFNADALLNSVRSALKKTQAR